MNPLKSFKEFVNEGVVRKQSPDLERARYLVKEAEDSFKSLIEMLEKIGINDQNANTFIKNAYDPVMELIRAILLMRGFNSSGSYAHEAEVAYLRELDFSEADVQFANQLRYFRNGITYYGKKFDAEYAEKVVDFTKKIYPRLQGMIKKIGDTTKNSGNHQSENEINP